MHKFVSLNLEFIRGSDAKLPALSPAAIYGRGVFTTIAIYDGHPFMWESHWTRISDNAAHIGMDISSFSEEATRIALGELVDENKVVKGRARITLLDESAGGLWRFESDRKTSMLIATADFQPRAAKLRLGLSSRQVNSTSALAGVKSCNYLENLLALQESKDLGFDEAIRLNERGEITSACMANVFWLKGDRLFTPSLVTGCLAGTTREFVFENLDCEQIKAGADELEAADEIFLTSAGIGIAQVAEFNGRALGGKSHPITSLLPALA